MMYTLANQLAEGINDAYEIRVKPNVAYELREALFYDLQRDLYDYGKVEGTFTIEKDETGEDCIAVFGRRWHMDRDHVLQKQAVTNLSLNWAIGTQFAAEIDETETRGLTTVTVFNMINAGEFTVSWPKGMPLELAGASGRVYYVHKDGFKAVPGAKQIRYLVRSEQNPNMTDICYLDGTVSYANGTPIERCEELVTKGTWVRMTEPPEIAPRLVKAKRQTLLEAARTLKCAYQEIKRRVEAGTLADDFSATQPFNMAEDAWCRIEEFEQNLEDPDMTDTSFHVWEGSDAYPDGLRPGDAVEVNLRDGSIRVGFRSDFEWMAGDMPSDIVSYRAIGDVLSAELKGD